MDCSPAIPTLDEGVRLDDLAQIVQAYHRVTENLQRSHDALAGEVRRLQQELASSDAQLQRSKRLAALGEMAAGIAHEIRNPLAAIHLYASMLVEDLSPEANAGQMAAKIAHAVRGLNAIVTDVLAFARDIAPRRQRVIWRDLVDRAIDAVTPQLRAAGAMVQCDDLADGDHLSLEADPHLMHQVLLNLLRNAVEAGATTVRLSAALDEAGFVQLSVHDDGPGIPDEAIDRIFNPFFTTRNTGTGLGLAIVHRIVDAHGGAISVHNAAAPRRGAVFTLTLPQSSPSSDNACGLASAAAESDLESVSLSGARA
jgi:signal transduction histidine kinase